MAMRRANNERRLALWTLVPTLVVTMALGCASAPTSGVQPDGSFRETFEAFAVSMGTSNPPVIPPGTTAMIQININRWTTAEERQKLLTQLKENGQEGLVRALQDQEETGWVVNRSQTVQGARRQAAMGTSAPSQRLRYAWQIDQPGAKRRIVAALDRPIGFAEASRGAATRWRDHDVTLIVLDVDEKGNGEGQLAMGVQLEIDEQNRLTIQNFGSEPVRLNNVRRR
jgi:hypothetical protein